VPERDVCRSAAGDAEHPEFRDHAERRHEHVYQIYSYVLMKFRRAIVFGIISMILSFAAIAGENTVVLSSRLWSQPAEQDFILNQILPPFEEANNCQVIFQLIENDWKLLTQITEQMKAGHVTTDVVLVYVDGMREWVENGYVMDLTEYTRAWKIRTFPQSLVKFTSFDGRQYFLPIGADVYLFIINQKALKYTPKGVNIQTLTWEQVVEWARAIAEEEGEGKFALTAAPQKMLIYQYGGVMLSYGGSFPVINSPEALQAWELLVKMQHVHTPNVLTYTSVVEPMKREEAWLAFAHCARIGDIYRSNPSQFIVSRAPKGSAGMGSVMGTSGFAVLNDAPHKELALKLVEYMTRPDIQIKIAKGTGGFIPPVEEALPLLSNTIEDEIIYKALQVMDQGVLAFIPPMFGETWGSVKLLYEDAFRKLVLEDGAVDRAYLDSLQEEIDAFEVEGLLLKSSSTIRGN
jgi:multiple sugar transport system substrate-binding protein